MGADGRPDRHRARCAAVGIIFDQAYSIARQVIELREKHGLTQTQLADETGIPQAQMSRIERGVVAPTTTTLAKIGEALGADLRFVERAQAAE